MEIQSFSDKCPNEQSRDDLKHFIDFHELRPLHRHTWLADDGACEREGHCSMEAERPGETFVSRDRYRDSAVGSACHSLGALKKIVCFHVCPSLSGIHSRYTYLLFICLLLCSFLLPDEQISVLSS